MGQESSSENRMKASPVFAGSSRASKTKAHGSPSSHTVKVISADKKTETRAKKLPSISPDSPSSNRTKDPIPNERIKDTQIAELWGKVAVTQSRNEIRMKTSLDNYMESEAKAQAELSECMNELELKKSEVGNLLEKVGSLEGEKANLSEQLLSLGSVMGKKQDEVLELKRLNEELEVQKSDLSERISFLVMSEDELELKRSEVDGLLEKVGLLEGERANLSEQLGSVMGKQQDEVLELRRLNKELQLQKSDMSQRISFLESKASESDVVEKIKAEASTLKDTNEDLCKQVEGLQTSRINEVEELAYIRWINSCLKDELRTCSYTPIEQRESISFLPYQIEEDYFSDTATKQEMKSTDCNWDYSESSGRRPQDLVPNKKRQSDSFVCMKLKEADKRGDVQVSENCNLEVSNGGRVHINHAEFCKATTSLDMEKRVLRVPNPPPKPSCIDSTTGLKQETLAPSILPPPPPPPPHLKLSSAKTKSGKVQRVPQVVEFYHSLMKREARKDCLNSGAAEASDKANVHSNMIGEIENRSSHLLAIKADVETQGEFVNSLIREVNNAVYQDVEDVVAFVKWLDNELCFLVDERAVLKHFEWPEKKADTLREVAFGYGDLKKLEQEVLNYKDDTRLPCDVALKKMTALSERMERSVQTILRTRDALMRRCKEFHIPTEWMLDMGILSKIKAGSVKVAKTYMKRVAMELQSKEGASDKESSRDYMLLQGVRFAFQIHQFAGGFDAETMHAFEELRDLAAVLNKS